MAAPKKRAKAKLRDIQINMRVTSDDLKEIDVLLDDMALVWRASLFRHLVRLKSVERGLR